MHTLKSPRRLAMIAAILAGSIAGTWAAALASSAQDASSTRYCANTLCTNILWLRAPVLRPLAR